MLSPSQILDRARDERGFTLVETLVAMVTGVIVTGALFAILQFSVEQTSRISQVAQATQVSRGSMTHIVDELHSACLSSNFAPVREGSSMTNLIFWNGYSEEAEVPSVYTAKGGSTGLKTEGARKDSIEWVEKSGLLIDKTWPSIGTEASGEYQASATPTTVRLSEHVSSEKWVNPVTKKEEPSIFRYYEYSTVSSTGTTEAAATLKEINLTAGKTLTKEQAEKVSSVLVEYKTAPGDKEVKLGAGSEANEAATLSTQTTFAFSAPNSESKIEAGPCE